MLSCLKPSLILLKEKANSLPGGGGAAKLCLTWRCPGSRSTRRLCLPGDHAVAASPLSPHPPRSVIQTSRTPAYTHLVRKAPLVKYVSMSEPQKRCQKRSQVLRCLNQGTMDFHVNPQRRNAACGQKSQGHSVGCNHTFNLYLPSFCKFRGWLQNEPQENPLEIILLGVG